MLSNRDSSLPTSLTRHLGKGHLCQDAAALLGAEPSRPRARSLGWSTLRCFLMLKPFARRVGSVEHCSAIGT